MVSECQSPTGRRADVSVMRTVPRTQHQTRTVNSLNIPSDHPRPCPSHAVLSARPAATTSYHSPQPFYDAFSRDHPGEPVSEENFWTLWCKGRLTEADTPTIRLGATPFKLSSAHLHHPPIFFTGRVPFLPPTNSVEALKATRLIQRIVVKPLMRSMYQYTANKNDFMCLQKVSLLKSCQVPQVVQQQTPHQRASHRERLPGKCTSPLGQFITS